MEQTINGNLSNCIQYTNGFGGTTYYNICNGTSHWVPWGSLDWLGASVVMAVLLVIAAIIFALIFAVVR